MKKNKSYIELIIRLDAALLFAGLYFTNTFTAIEGIILLVFASVFVIKSLTGFCTLYIQLGLNKCTCKK